MLFRSLVPGLIEISIKQSKKIGEQQRDHAREMLEDFYENNFFGKDEYLLDWGFDKLNELPLICEPLTKRVIDEISMLYEFAPERYLVDVSSERIDNDGYSLFCQENPDLDNALDTIEKYRNLIGNCLLRFAYDKEHKKMCFFVETDYIPHFMPSNPLVPVGYSIPLKKDSGKHKSSSKNYYVYFSDEEIFVHDSNNKKITDKEELERIGSPFTGEGNPYAIMPIVDFSPFAVSEYWSVGELPLAFANRMLNIAILNMFYGQHSQMFDQPWTQGAEAGDDLKISPFSIVNLPEGASAGLLGFNPKLLESTEMLERWIARILDNYGLTANFNEQGDILSGVALKVKKMRLLKKRKKDINLFRPHEEKIFNIVKIMNEVDGLGYTIPDKSRPIVDYVEPEFPTDKQDERDDWDWRVQRNLSNWANFLVKENPQIDEQTAQKQIDENRAANSQFRAAFAAAQTPIEPEEGAEDA